MTLYRHRQIATAILWALGLSLAATALAVLLLVPADAREVMTMLGVVIVVDVLCMLLFGALTVEVTGEAVSVWFGAGFPRKTIPVADVREVHVARNRWYWGIGVRLTPHGWMFNASGLDAVQLQRRSGSGFRIGTDEPHELETAIRRAMERRRSG